MRSEFLGDNKDVCDKYLLDLIKARNLAAGQRWACYQNFDMSSGMLGHLEFLKTGPGCTYEQPPEKMPDTHMGAGWRYQFVGFLDVEKNVITKD